VEPNKHRPGANKNVLQGEKKEPVICKNKMNNLAPRQRNPIILEISPTGCGAFFIKKWELKRKKGEGEGSIAGRKLNPSKKNFQEEETTWWWARAPFLRVNWHGEEGKYRAESRSTETEAGGWREKLQAITTKNVITVYDKLKTGRKNSLTIGNGLMEVGHERLTGPVTRKGIKRSRLPETKNGVRTQDGPSKEA